jgi:hypothetical protein
MLGIMAATRAPRPMNSQWVPHAAKTTDAMLVHCISHSSFSFPIGSGFAFITSGSVARNAKMLSITKASHFSLCAKPITRPTVGSSSTSVAVEGFSAMQQKIRFGGVVLNTRQRV